jgi:WD40 repeat protein
MDPTDDERKKPSRPRQVVAVVAVLGVMAIVAVALRSSQAPVEVSAAGEPTETALDAGPSAPAVDDPGTSPSTLLPHPSSSTTTTAAAPSSTTASTVKVKSTTPSTTPASSSTTTTAAPPLPPSLLGKVVFAASRNGIGGIWVMDADGANPRNLNPAPGHVPDLAPDGRHIVYNSGPGSGDLMIMGSDGSDLRMLVPAISVYTPPSWSPDGRRVLYADAAGLHTINPDGTEDRMVFSPPKSQYNDGLSIFGASWAPDGRRLVVTSLGASSADGLWIVDLDAQSAIHVYTGSAHEVAWSPLGDRIAFSGGPNPAIFTVRPDGTDLRQLTGLPGQFDGVTSATYPAWSGDGSRIAFTLDQHDPEIWDIGADGSGLRKLTDAARHPTF